jgi:nucleoside phosphorylase
MVWGNHVGLVVPMEKEALGLLEQMQDIGLRCVQQRRIIQGRLGTRRVSLVLTGCEKIASASGTQLLLGMETCSTIVHLGSAGAIDPRLAIGDVVLASVATEYDFLQKFGEIGPLPAGHADAALLKTMQAQLEAMDHTVWIGPLLSGNETLSPPKDVMRSCVNTGVVRRLGELCVRPSVQPRWRPGCHCAGYLRLRLRTHEHAIC